MVLFHKPSVFKNFKNESPKVWSPSPLFPTIFAFPIIPEADAPRLYIQFDSISSLPSTSDWEKVSYFSNKIPLTASIFGIALQIEKAPFKMTENKLIFIIIVKCTSVISVNQPVLYESDE